MEGEAEPRFIWWAEMGSVLCQENKLSSDYWYNMLRFNNISQYQLELVLYLFCVLGTWKLSHLNQIISLGIILLVVDTSLILKICVITLGILEMC